jgi:hypothetical protein
MCLTLGLQLTEKAEETPQQAQTICNLINLWSEAYDMQVKLQTSSPIWLAVAAPALLAPALRLCDRVYETSLFSLCHGCHITSLALPLASQVVSVPSSLRPITQALTKKQQDPQDADHQDLTCFNLLQKYKVIYQSPLLMHITCLCDVQMVHAGAFASLGHQPFFGGGQASLPNGAAQRLVRHIRPCGIAEGCLPRARDLFLISYVLQPLDELLQQLLELRQAHKQLCTSAVQEKESRGNTIATEEEHGRQDDCGVAASSSSGRGSSSSRSRGDEKDSSTGSITGKGFGCEKEGDGKGTGQGATSSRIGRGSDQGPAINCCQSHGPEQQQEKSEQQQGNLAQVVSDAQVDWLFFNVTLGDSQQQRLVVDSGRYRCIIDHARLLQCLVETLLLVWPKPTTPPPTTARSSSGSNAIHEESSSNGSGSRGVEGGCSTTGSSSDTSGPGISGQCSCGADAAATAGGGGGGGITSRLVQQPSSSKQGSQHITDQRSCSGYGVAKPVAAQGSNSSSKDGIGGGSNGSSGGSSSGKCDNSREIGQQIHDDLPDFSPESRWPWILTLAAMFQRASLGGRLKFLKQGQSTLLLQLLYQVLLEDRGLGGQGMEVGARELAILSVARADVDVEECLAAISGTGVLDFVEQLWDDGQLVGVEVHTLVLLVLQCLLYKPLRADRKTLKKLQPSRLMLVECGKGWCSVK